MSKEAKTKEKFIQELSGKVQRILSLLNQTSRLSRKISRHFLVEFGNSTKAHCLKGDENA